MTRPRHEIMRDLKAILAELDYVMGNDTADTGEFSPKLAQALAVELPGGHLDKPGPGPRETRASMPTTAEQPIESHEDIRAKARAYKPMDYDFNNAPRQPDISPIATDEEGELTPRFK